MQIVIFKMIDAKLDIIPATEQYFKYLPDE